MFVSRLAAAMVMALALEATSERALAQQMPVDAQKCMVCLQRIECSRYHEAADLCATAGDIRQCMNIKLNGAYDDAANSCDISGKVTKNLTSMGISQSIVNIPDYECYPTYAELRMTLATSGYYVPSCFNTIKKALE